MGSAAGRGTTELDEVASVGAGPHASLLADAAEVLGKRPGAVRMAQARALDKLREKLLVSV